MKELTIAFTAFFLLSSFTILIPQANSESAFVTLSVGTYTAITLSSGYISNISFPITTKNALATATGNGNGSSYPLYYVTFNGNVQGNVSFSATNFTGAGNIDKNLFAMNLTINGYPSSNHLNNVTFATNNTYGFLNNNDRMYSNYWVFVPSTVVEGDYLSVVTVVVSEA